MAKSSNFFGLRRGSTKSLTFQVYRGEQITKDRVTHVSNPQTTAQMQQRLIVPMVASARSKLKGLVNHSFEGVSYGDESLKKFSQMNLSKGQLAVRSYVPKNAMDTGVANFIVSNGSLAQIGYATGDNNKTIELDGYSYGEKSVTKFQATQLTPIPAEINLFGATKFVAQLLGLPEHHQITFLVQYANGRYESIKVDDNGETTSLLYRHTFAIARIMNADNAKYEVVDASDTGITIRLKGSPLSIKVTCDFTLLLQDGTVPAPGNKDQKYLGRTNLTKVEVILNTTEEYQVISAAAVIYSDLSSESNTNWRRSFARLVPTEYERPIPYATVIDSYLKPSTTSLRYLNNGDESTGIDGDEEKVQG